MPSHRLLGLSGSLRAASENTKLVHAAARAFDAAEFTLGDINLPLYDGDLEAAGIPAVVQTLAQQIRDADAVVISSPEYNKGISGAMKNALDWISRVEGSVLADKPVAVMSAAAGRSGGETAQFMLRACLVPHRANVLVGNGVMVAGAAKEFDADGNLISASYQKAVDNLMADLRAAI